MREREERRERWGIEREKGEGIWKGGRGGESETENSTGQKPLRSFN